MKYEGGRNMNIRKNIDKAHLEMVLDIGQDLCYNYQEKQTERRDDTLTKEQRYESVAEEY